MEISQYLYAHSGYIFIILHSGGIMHTNIPINITHWKKGLYTKELIKLTNQMNKKVLVIALNKTHLPHL